VSGRGEAREFLCSAVRSHILIYYYSNRQAAIARREKNMTSSFDSVNETTTPNLKSPRLRERQIDEHEQGKDEVRERETETGSERCAQSNKRTKISASGSWREGDQAWSDKGAALDSVNSSFSSLFSSSSTETVDISATAISRDSFNHDEKEQDEEQSNAYSPLSSTFRKLHIHEYGAPPSSDSGFTIYEDPEDRVIRDFGFYMPEDWYRYPEDDKENTDGLDDEDEETSVEESELFGGEEIDHQRPRRRQHFDHSQDTRMYYYHDVQWNSPSISVDEYTDTGGEIRLTERNPHLRYFNSRMVSFSEGEELSSFREVRGATETMSFLGAPPRRFLGRGRQ